MGGTCLYRLQPRDEYYTPPVLVRAIVPHIRPRSVVWCPFDTCESEFVLQLTDAGHTVLHSHIWDGRDFFDYEPPQHYDCIISNPPFTKKLEVFERLYQFGKPFAMVMGLPVLNYQCVGEFFLERQLQLLIVDKKVSFDGNKSSFNNSYWCYQMLPRDLLFCHLEHDNTGRNFQPSRMRQA